VLAGTAIGNRRHGRVRRIGAGAGFPAGAVGGLPDREAIGTLRGSFGEAPSRPHV